VDDRMNGNFPTIQANLLGICSGLGMAPGAGKISAAAAIRIGVSGRLVKPRPDALETLETIRGRGMKTALITDCTPEVPGHVGRSLFVSLFDAMVFSSVVRMKKPDPRIYGIACAKLGVGPAECLYVGDGGSGELTGAGKLGMTPLRINAQDIEYSLGHKSEALTWPGLTVRSLKAVLEYC
jgi:putative hydrolase of the HAD superfamily